MSHEFAAAAPLTSTLADRVRNVRSFSEELCATLEPEDMVIQSMPDVSPIRWHLAHTTWFFETFLLKEFVEGYQPANDQFEYLFNSYYNTVGKQFPRSQRGLLSRPTVREVFEYRRQVDDVLLAFVSRQDLPTRAKNILEVGLQHEQQHQELMLTDIKHVFSCNPLLPAYRPLSGDSGKATSASVPAPEFLGFDGGLVEIGYAGDEFCYDNEQPRHQVYLQPFKLAERLLTCGEVLQFIEAGGYQRPEFWLSAGWQTVEANQWRHPFYWWSPKELPPGMGSSDAWHVFTLGGLRELDPHEPACHLSYFEADAIARFFEARLPTEAEWEIAAQAAETKGSFVEGGHFHPVANSSNTKGLSQMYGELWQWTASQYMAYPGYAPPAGALGEYNGKFMCNQFVLRGGSCAASQSHIRRTYRNFFPPEARWQFSGVRLAR